MDDPGQLNFKVCIQVFGGKYKPLEYLLMIKKSSVHLLEKQLNLAFVPEITARGNVCMAESLEVRSEFRTMFSNPQLRNFLYAILHSTIYQSERRSQLQVNFSRFHFPGKTEDFWNLESLGEILIRLHAAGFFEKLSLETGFPVTGSNVIEPSEFRLEAETHRLWINKEQYFSNVPAQLWHYKTGGMQPLLRWFEVQSGHYLRNEDIYELRTLTSFLTETVSTSKKIDGILSCYSSADKS
jgi:hypothetical protein